VLYFSLPWPVLYLYQQAVIIFTPKKTYPFIEKF
jgi:hypothetical protein